MENNMKDKIFMRLYHVKEKNRNENYCIILKCKISSLLNLSYLKTF